MRSSTRAIALLVTGMTLTAGACAEATLDTTVVMDHEVVPAQPWVATGDLVDAGLLCPSGDRHSIAMWHPDGSPMTIAQFVQLVDAAFAKGLDVWHVRRVTEREHLCDDGSGAFTMREDATGPVNRSTADVIRGTGAYTGMRGSCVIELAEDASRQIVEIAATCEFDLGPAE